MNAATAQTAGQRAERKDAGDYVYRGYRIFDMGGGRSVHAAMERSGQRWVIRRITGTGYFDTEFFSRAYTFKDAKKKVDRFLEDGRKT